MSYLYLDLINGLQYVTFIFTVVTFSSTCLLYGSGIFIHSSRDYYFCDFMNWFCVLFFLHLVHYIQLTKCSAFSHVEFVFILIPFIQHQTLNYVALVHKDDLLMGGWFIFVALSNSSLIVWLWSLRNGPAVLLVLDWPLTVGALQLHPL